MQLLNMSYITIIVGKIKLFCGSIFFRESSIFEVLHKFVQMNNRFYVHGILFWKLKMEQWISYVNKKKEDYYIRQFILIYEQREYIWFQGMFLVIWCNFNFNLFFIFTVILLSLFFFLFGTLNLSVCLNTCRHKCTSCI